MQCGTPRQRIGAAHGRSIVNHEILALLALPCASLRLTCAGEWLRRCIAFMLRRRMPRGESLMMQRVARFAVILTIGLMCLSPRGAEAAAGPSDVVRHFYDALLNTMQNAAALGAKGRFQKLEPVVLATFDVPFMTHLSVGPSWAKLSPEQNQSAWKAFARYITATYATQFHDFSGEQFRNLGEQRIKHATIVTTQ